MLFYELATAGQLISLEDFNVYVFHGFQEEFKDLVTSFVTKAEPLLYANLYSYLLTLEFIHKTSLQSMRSIVINAPLLPTPITPPLALVAQYQPSRNFDRNMGRFHGEWCPNYGSGRVKVYYFQA